MITVTYLKIMRHIFLLLTGPELIFVIYPQGLSPLPSPAIWAFLYFLMVLTLGLDSQVIYQISPLMLCRP